MEAAWLLLRSTSSAQCQLAESIRGARQCRLVTLLVSKAGFAWLPVLFVPLAATLHLSQRSLLRCGQYLCPAQTGRRHFGGGDAAVSYLARWLLLVAVCRPSGGKAHAMSANCMWRSARQLVCECVCVNMCGTTWLRTLCICARACAYIYQCG